MLLSKSAKWVLKNFTTVKVVSRYIFIYCKLSFTKMSDAGLSTSKEKESKQSKQKKIVDYDSSDEDVRGEKRKLFEVEPLKDYYCAVCRAQMNSDFTWQTHIDGKRHIKKMKLSTCETQRQITPVDANCQQYRVPGGSRRVATHESDEPAQFQQFFDMENKEPIVGLDFIKEIWLKEEDAEPLYHCGLCQADCQRIVIYDHVIGSRHRRNYLKLKDSDRIIAIMKFIQKNSSFTTELRRETFRMEKRYGRGFIKVAVEVEGANYDDLNVVNMDVESPCNSSTNDNKEKKDKKEKRRAFKPESKPEEENKVEELTIEEKVKGLSASTIRSKFEALPYAEQIAIMQKIETLPQTRIGDKAKDIAKLQKMKNIGVGYLKGTPQAKQYAKDALNRNFEWSNALMRKMCRKAFFKNS